MFITIMKYSRQDLFRFRVCSLRIDSTLRQNLQSLRLCRRHRGIKAGRRHSRRTAHSAPYYEHKQHQLSSFTKVGLGNAQSDGNKSEPLIPPPTLYIFNAASIVKPHAIEKLAAEFIGYGVDIAVISETHLKKKHADSCVSIDGYLLFRRDRARRKCGGVAVYIRHSSTAAEYKPPVAGNNPDFEILWVKVVQSGDVHWRVVPPAESDLRDDTPA